MQRSHFEKNWNQLKNNIQNRWSKLSNEDIDEIDGMYDQFVTHIAKRYGYPREKAAREIENWQPQEQMVEEESMEESETETVEEQPRGKKHEKIREWQDIKQDQQQQQQQKEKKRKAG